MSRTSRRDFAKTLAIATATVPLASLAQPAPEEKPPSQLGKAMTEIVRASYSQHLTPEELEQIGKSLNEYGPYIEEFRKFKLANADEPDFTFRALEERW